MVQSAMVMSAGSGKAIESVCVRVYVHSKLEISFKNKPLRSSFINCSRENLWILL